MHGAVTLGPPCPEEAIRDAESRIGVSLPEGLQHMLMAGDGRFDEDGQWWVAWPLDRIVAENLAAWQERGLPRSYLAIGDDGTGDPFCLELSERRDRVVRWSWVDSGVQADEGRWANFCRAWLGAP